MTDNFVTITEENLKRGWSDLEPKIAAALLSGFVSDGLLTILQSYHVAITPQFAQLIPLGCALLGGYLTKSKAKTITKTVALDSNTTMEKTITAPTRIIPAEKNEWLKDAVKNVSGNLDEPLIVPMGGTVDDQATAILH